MSASLRSTHRSVPPDRAAAYLADWADVRAAVERAGGRAWLFREAGNRERFLEFIEHRAAPGLPDRPEVARALLALEERYGPSAPEDWVEAG